MNREAFSEQLRDLLSNFHDFLALEKHPFGAVLPRPDISLSRAEVIRRFVEEGIQALRPKDKTIHLDGIEWRYYLILYGRYVEGISVIDIQKRLAIGERQERRIHGRALMALENVLWDRFSQFLPQQETQLAARIELQSKEEDVTYPIKLEPIPLDKIIKEVVQVYAPRSQASGVEVCIDLPGNLPLILADRIILRQILLQILNEIIQIVTEGEIGIWAGVENNTVRLDIQIVAKIADLQAHADLIPNQFWFWLDRLNGKLTIHSDDKAHPDNVILSLTLPRANQAKILVVDDHEPAIRIIHRFLSHTNIQIIGITDPHQVISMARNLHPDAVLLDVMMPSVDGWEILQALKSDPETETITVIVCSVWDQPELAFSLGANGFLKKPINQQDLMDVLVRSNLLDTLGGSSQAGS